MIPVSSAAKTGIQTSGDAPRTCLVPRSSAAIVVLHTALSRLVLVALSALALILAPTPASAQRIACPTTLETAPVTVKTTTGEAHVFEAEIALTPDTRSCGLMFRESLAKDAAMLFVYPGSARRAFWMENTLIPLDIIFADQAGRVLNVAARAVPLDRTPLPSVGAAQFVLEIQGGLAATLGIGPGARLLSPAMVDAAARAR